MRLEAVKSFVLVILIGISLLLTLGLWSTSPGGEQVYDSAAVREVNVGGVTVKNRDIIRPSDVIFHIDQKVYGFESPKKRNSFFKDTNQWEIDPIDTNQVENTSSNKDHVEVIFPTSVPFEFLPGLYTLDENFVTPNWPVKKIEFSPDEQTNAIHVKFISENDSNEAYGIINNHTNFEELNAHFADKSKFVSYETIPTGSTTLYLPTEQVKMTHWVLSIKKIDERLFVNTLFNNPSAVGKNIGEGSYLDGQRALRISPDRRSMEYINPHQITENPASSNELLQNSLDQINEHKGWTGTYNLFDIDLHAESIKYRLFYESSPVFNTSGLATIQQQWRDRELHNYRRPLFELMTPLTNEPVILPSGTYVYEQLRKTDLYEIDQVEELRSGYRLDYHDDYSSVTLEPCWFMLYKGNWQEVPLDEFGDQEGA